jgi:hypothetical protein
LVIPSQKRRTKKRNETVAVSKILSKAQRKRLQKIVDKKKKKENVSVQNFYMKFTKTMISFRVNVREGTEMGATDTSTLALSGQNSYFYN